MKSNILKSSTITGQTVYNLNNENIGSIQDLMIDPNEGIVAYAVLSFGGFLGIGSKYFAIPIEALQFNSDNNTITLDVNKEKLENAPSFDQDQWPMTYNPEFIDSVYDHYGYENRRQWEGEERSARERSHSHSDITGEPGQQGRMSGDGGTRESGEHRSREREREREREHDESRFRR